MAMKLSSTSSLRHLLCANGKSFHRQALRQFAGTTLRTKDVASQEDVPNMRHAPRPREYAFRMNKWVRMVLKFL